MPEHAIRLRAAWQGIDPDDAAARPFRVDLPVDWATFSWPASRPPRRLRLSRPFGRPAGPWAGSTPARLTLDAAPGVRAIEFNGDPLPWREAADGRLTADLPPLSPRNVLIVEIVPAEVPPGLWGEAALVFGPPSSEAGETA